MDKNKNADKKPLATKGRRLVVVKKRKKAVGVLKKASGALPTFQRRTVTTVTAGSPPRQGTAPDDHDAFDDVLAALPNDCALGIQSLQQDANTRLAIPLPQDTSHYLHGVLELHVYRKMPDAGDNVVSCELAQLHADNTIRTLSSPSRQACPLQVLVFTTDYVRAARQTIRPNDAPSQQATEWMIRQLPHLIKSCLAYTDWQAQWEADPVAGTSLDRVLDTLTRQQELLLTQPLDESYQLWLPTWGVVLQAWDTARQKVLANLKRSSYKERSLRALQQPYSPISTPLLLDWMESMGEVEIVDRPAGKFVRMPPPEG